LSRIEKTVFISYRRANVAWALAIYQSLTHHGFDVFFDYQGIAAGDFERAILDNVRARAHFLVLLTPSALERIDEPDDWLRREIETALEHTRNIVPLMLEGFDFGTPKVAARLTGTIAPLKRYNGVPVVASYFDAAMDRLRKHLDVALDEVPHPPSLAAAIAARHQQTAAAGAPLVEQRELTAEQWFERAFAAGDPGTRIADYTEVIRLKPDHAGAHRERASSRKTSGDLHGALADYNEAIRLGWDNPDIFYGRAQVREKLHQVADAIADYQKYLDLGGGARDGNQKDVERLIIVLRGAGGF